MGVVSAWLLGGLWLGLACGAEEADLATALSEGISASLEGQKEEEATILSQGSWSRVLRKVSPSIDQIMNFCSAKHQHGELVCLAHCTVFYGTQNVVKIGCETNYPDPKAWKRCFCYILEDFPTPKRIPQIQPVRTTVVEAVPATTTEALPTSAATESATTIATEAASTTETPIPTTTTLPTSTLPMTSPIPLTNASRPVESSTTSAPANATEKLVDLELPVLEVVGEEDLGLKIASPEEDLGVEVEKDENDLAEEIAEAEEAEEKELAALIHKKMLAAEEDLSEEEAEAEANETLKIIVHQKFPSPTTLPPSTTEEPIPSSTTSQALPILIDEKEEEVEEKTKTGVEAIPALPEHKPGGGIAGGYFIYKPQLGPSEWSERAHCEVGEWGAWHRCTRTCGGGRKARLRSVTQLPRGDGDQCPKLFETEVCSSEPCPVQNCEVSSWRTVEWCRGPAACQGSRVRLRTILAVPHNGGTPCPPLYDVQHCANILPQCSRPVGSPTPSNRLF